MSVGDGQTGCKNCDETGEAIKTISVSCTKRLVHTASQDRRLVYNIYIYISFNLNLNASGFSFDFGFTLQKVTAERTPSERLLLLKEFESRESLIRECKCLVTRVSSCSYMLQCVCMCARVLCGSEALWLFISAVACSPGSVCFIQCAEHWDVNPKLPRAVILCSFPSF